MHLINKTKASRILLEVLRDKLLENPNSNINWKKLSKDGSITMTNIKENDTLNWDWREISKNPNITAEFINEYYHKNKLNDWRSQDWTNILYYSKQIKTKDIIKYSNLPWSWNEMYITTDYNCTKPRIHLDFVLQHPHLKWNWYRFTEHIPIEFIIQNLQFGWNWYYVTSKLTTSNLELVKKYKNKNWSWHDLSNITTLEFLKENIEEHWNWDEIAKNPNITMEFIEENINIPWDWNNVVKNKNFDFNFLLRSRDLIWDWGWNWDIITECACQKNRKFIFEHLKTFPWNYRIVNKNIPDIDFKIIKQNPDLDWDYTILSKHKNLNLSFVKKCHKLNWDWYYLTKYHKNEKISAMIKKYPKKNWDTKLLYYQSRNLYISMISKIRKNCDVVNTLFSKDVYGDLCKIIKESEKRKYSIIYHRFTWRKNEGRGM